MDGFASHGLEKRQASFKIGSFTSYKETQAALFSRNLGSSDAGIQKPCFSG